MENRDLLQTEETILTEESVSTSERPPAVSFLLEGGAVLCGALIGYFCFDRLLFGVCFGLGVGVAMSMILHLYAKRPKREITNESDAEIEAE